MKDAHFAVTFRRELRKDLEKEKESKYDLGIISGSNFWSFNRLDPVLAIKMLFWPRKPVRIPGLPFEWYGLLPKRQDLARSIGETITIYAVSVIA